MIPAVPPVGAVWRTLAVLLLGLLPGWAQAHVAGYTDTSVQVAATGVRIIYTLPTDSLLELAGRMPAGNPDREASARPGPPDAYLPAVKAGWVVQAAGERCLLTQAQARALDRLPSYQYQFSYVCPRGLDELTVRYGLFVDKWREHENFVRVFMAGQRMRMRFTADQPQLHVPVASLLAQWRQPLAAGFFAGDPNRGLQDDLQGREGGLPRIAEASPTLGALDFDQIDPGFIRLGLEHIFVGLDHVLFVVGLVMLTHAWRQLLVLVSAFTLAHTLTLGLSTLGLIHFEPRWAEPLIALTIVYIGLENLWALHTAASAGPPAATRSLLRRTLLVFVFGLIHGVGFSYVLREMGLREDLLGSLLYFNLGVEIGQLAIIAAGLPLVLAWRRLPWGGRLSAAVSAAVACTGVAMLLGRV